VRNFDTDNFMATNPVEASCQVPVILGYRKQTTIIRSDMLLNDKVVFLSASRTNKYCWKPSYYLPILKSSDDGVYHSELLDFWTLSIVRYSRK
jgi:hypothetical protein